MAAISESMSLRMAAMAVCSEVEGSFISIFSTVCALKLGTPDASLYEYQFIVKK